MTTKGKWLAKAPVVFTPTRCTRSAEEEGPSTFLPADKNRDIQVSER